MNSDYDDFMPDMHESARNLIISLARSLKAACEIAMQYERRDSLDDSLEIAESIIRDFQPHSQEPQ